jgi:hypothetical protein
MPVFDLFSKRQKREQGGEPEIYTYADIPRALRVQVVHIMLDAIGDSRSEGAGRVYGSINRILCREYGIFQLSRGDYPQEQLVNFFLEEKDHNRVLDVIEVGFRHIVLRDKFGYTYHDPPLASSPSAAILELNRRFEEHAIGYAFTSGRLIRRDSEFIHSEITKQALALLTGKRFRGVNEEFLKAHEHYRHERYKECLNECLKSLESTLKVVCASQKWPYSETDTAKTLINVCFEHGLLPSFLNAQFGSLRSLLESGVPAMRNRLSGHGQGAEERIVPGFLAAYSLHLTGAAILFIAGAEAELHRAG